MIKAIIFDNFGVLTRDKWKEFVATLPQEQKQPARDINHAYDAGHMDEAEFLSGIKKLTGRSPGEVENLAISEIGKNEELLLHIKQLKANYKIGLISNIASNWIRETLLNKAEQELFDDMVLSFEVGMTKPDPRIYQIACERLGVEPRETVFVDDIESYCEAARAVGMQAVCYHDFVQFKAELEQILSHA